MEARKELPRVSHTYNALALAISAEWPGGAVTTLPLPLYALNAKVRYTPYHRREEWPTPSHPEPWRVIGIEVTTTLDIDESFRYRIQPWTLTGTWMLDRPMQVWEHMLAAWPDEAV